MIHIKGTDTDVSVMLTTSSVTVNNLTVSVDSNGNCEIETKGAWSGSLSDLISIVEQATGLHLDCGKDQ